jgi:hypothetical protein
VAAGKRCRWRLRVFVGSLRSAGGEFGEQLFLHRRRQAAGSASPQGPPFRPVLALVDVLDALRQQLAQLLDPPLVERVAEARAQAVTGEIEPQPLVLRRAAPTPGALHQRVEQRAQQGISQSSRLPSRCSSWPRRRRTSLLRPVANWRRRCARSTAPRRRSALARPAKQASTPPRPRHATGIRAASAGWVVAADTVQFERTDFGHRRSSVARALRAGCRRPVPARPSRSAADG